MYRTKRFFSPAISAGILTLAATLGAVLASACASNTAMVPDPDAPHTESTVVSSASAASATAASTNNAPCGPSDCTPCDELRQKCMGPMVCGGHPERASRQCARATNGECRDMIVCAP